MKGGTRDARGAAYFHRANSSRRSAGTKARPPTIRRETRSSRSLTLTFVSEALKNYSEIRSPFPSSAYLARAMVEALGRIPPERPIVELGPGTGAFTRLLLRRFPRNPVFAVERNPRFAKLLSQKYPRLRVGKICASKLCAYLRENGVTLGSVGGVLSGLPLTGFDKQLRLAIFEAIERALIPGGRYVQMTYHRLIWRSFHPAGLVSLPAHRVWRNIPPAVVLTFRKDRTAPAV